MVVVALWSSWDCCVAVAPSRRIVVVSLSLYRFAVVSCLLCSLCLWSYIAWFWSLIVVIGHDRNRLLLGKGDVAMTAIVRLVVVGC
jgi:hypothetical protein